MIIDDEKALVRLVERVLGTHHEVVGLSDARRALAVLATGEHFDAILCDLMMPEMSGMELYAELEKAHPAVLPRMVFLTGGAFTPGAGDFLERVPNRTIEKPFNPRTLRAVVGELMANAAL
jgi:CheY-like chemotaxis protein